MYINCVGMLVNNSGLTCDMSHKFLALNSNCKNLGPIDVSDLTKAIEDSSSHHEHILSCTMVDEGLFDLIKAGLISVIYTYNDIRSVCALDVQEGASFEEVFFNGKLHTLVDQYYRFSSMRESVYMQSHDLLILNVRKELLNIAKYLHAELSLSEMNDVYLELRKDGKLAELDLFYKTDIPNKNYKELLKKSELKKIESEFGDWFQDSGYQLSTKKSERRKFRKKDMPKFYSQNGEDCFLLEFFDWRKTGFYVEVGSFDGVHLSNSYAFELIGWSGICIEPNKYYELCKNNRPGATCINVACVANADVKKLEFYEEELGLLSSLEMDSDKEEDIINRYNKRKLDYTGTESYVVECLTLNSILNNFRNDIDFVSVDVEGTELDVLRGLDLNRYKSRVLLIEINDDSQDVIDYLTISNQYFLAKKMGVNYIFVRTKSDFFKARDIDVNCYIEKQMHPLGKRHTPDICQTGFYVKEGVKVFEIELTRFEKLKQIASKMYSFFWNCK